MHVSTVGVARGTAPCTSLRIHLRCELNKYYKTKTKLTEMYKL